MSRKNRKHPSRAQRREARNKSREYATLAAPERSPAPSDAACEPSPPLRLAPPQSQKSVGTAPPVSLLRPLLPVLCAIISLFAGIGIKRWNPESSAPLPTEAHSAHVTVDRLEQTPPSIPPPRPLHEWLETTLADFRTGTLSAFRFRKLLRERVKESPFEHLRDLITSPPFATMPNLVRSLAFQRMSEAPTKFVQGLFEANSPPNLNDSEVHILFGAQLRADLTGFALWLNSLPADRQMILAHELAGSVINEPTHVASAVGMLTPDTARAVIQHALTLLKSHPAKLLIFTAELPPSFIQTATLQGLQMALSLPNVAKGFSLAGSPRAISAIHESIRSSADASRYRDLLATEGVAEALPKGVARSLGFQFLFQRIASIHLDSALLRLSKLSASPDLEYATLGVVQGCASGHPLRALELAATLPSSSPRRHDALLLAAYAARNVDGSLSQRWLSSSQLSADERALLTGDLP